MHLLPVTINGICTRPAAHPACSGIVTSGRLSPSSYFAYVLVTGADATRGVAGTEFGIEYAAVPGQGVDVFEWRSCGTLDFPSAGWPAAGSGNLVTWDYMRACQRDEPGGAGSGVVANVGYFYLSAYSADQLRLTVRPVSGHARIADCSSLEYPIAGPGVSPPFPHLGYATFSADGRSPGYNPCAAVTTPLSCGISGPTTVAANSVGTLYTVAASQPGATFDWSISGSGALTILPPGNRALVDAVEGDHLALSVRTHAGSQESMCSQVVTIIPGACAVNGPGSMASGSSAQYFIGGVPADATIAWSLFGSGTILGPASGTDVTVSAGGPGLLTVQAAVTVATVIDTCSRRIEITPSTCAVIGPRSAVAGSVGIRYRADTDAVGGHFVWSVSGAAVISGDGEDEPTVLVTVGNGDFFDVSVHISGDGPERDCRRRVAILPPGDCVSGRTGVADLMVHLVPATSTPPCNRPSAAPNCSNIRTNGALFPQRYFAFLLVGEASGYYGVAGVKLGINYGSDTGRGIEIAGWNLCGTSEMPTADWPAPGSGNRIFWDSAHCQFNEPGGIGSGIVAAAGYFYLAAYSPDRLSIVNFPGAARNEYINCFGCAEGIGSGDAWAEFSRYGSIPGRNPCGVRAPVLRTTWSAIKALHGS